MPVNLSIKNVPDKLVAKLRARAATNHRSLQGELMNLIVNEVGKPRPLTITDLYQRAKATGYRSRSESTRMIREDRDSNHGRDPLPLG